MRYSDGDRDLGMDRAITRREFLNGVSMVVGSAVALPAGFDAVGRSQEVAREVAADNYPPVRVGMRGAHPGIHQAPHAARDGGTWETAENTGETYDLIVVGGGLSGLAAAYFFRKKTSPSARILIIDPHDDFGGHAKRNEFVHGGRVLMATGGTNYMVRPSTFPAAAREMLRDIGVELNHAGKAHKGLYESLGLRLGVFFDKETFGSDRLVVGGSLRPPTAEFIAKTPLPEHVRSDLLRLWLEGRDYLPGLSEKEKIRKLEKMSYRNYLLDVVKVHPDVLPYVWGVWCLGADCASAWFAFYRRSPGFQGLGLTPLPDSPDDPAIYAEGVNFVAGQSDVARLIVRSLIPDALPAGSMASVQLQRTNYARLDEPRSPVRIRLNSAAVRVRHVGDRPTGRFMPDVRETEVTYVRDGKAYRVRAQGCVLACDNAMIPYLCPEMPAKQKEALAMAVRSVNFWINVLVGDWKAFTRLGVSSVASPRTFFGNLSLGAPMSAGAYTPPRTPEEAILVQLGGTSSGILANEPMVRGFRGGTPMPTGLPVRDQFRALRMALYETTFETFERHIREHMARVLSPGGFDPARDIKAIVVNRYPHGFAMGGNSLFDPDWAEGEAPWVVGRKPFGRITIANSDAAGIDLTQAAYHEAHRAVDELLPLRWGFFSHI